MVFKAKVVREQPEQVGVLCEPPPTLFLLSIGCPLLLTFACVCSPLGYSCRNTFQFLCLGSVKIERNIAADKTSQAIASLTFSFNLSNLFLVLVLALENLVAESLRDFDEQSFKNIFLSSLRNWFNQSF